MKIKALAALGLMAVSAMASAQSSESPATPAPPTDSRPRGLAGPVGMEGPLGNELYYNYTEAFYGVHYSDRGGRNARVASNSNYGLNVNFFLFNPVYLLARYDRLELSYNASGVSEGAVSCAQTTGAGVRINVDQSNLGFGLGFRIPVGYATDLFGSGAYEMTEGIERCRNLNGAVVGTSDPDARGASFEAGVRTFMAGFSELSLSYQYREVREENRSRAQAALGRREILKDGLVVLGAVFPVYNHFAIFGRAEWGQTDSNFNDGDSDRERYLVGGRLSFNFWR